MKEIYPSIWVYENAFQESQKIINNVEAFIDNNPAHNWSWARTGHSTEENLQDSHRTNQSFSISPLQHIEEMKSVDDSIFNGTTSLIGQYAKHYDLGVLHDEGYSILKYKDGMQYKQHYDCGPLFASRVVSMLIYLNDEYAGGELEFPYLGVKHKPNTGDVILFPSNYTFSHIAHPVTEGTKYCVVTWMGYGNK
jgi:Rps23 Pro-64 3,4-dihydroxylase Tpa1-like proline 4-hydroxylase